VQSCIVFLIIFQYILCVMCSLAFLYIYIYYVFFYYKFILIEEFIKHDWLNYMYYNVRYLDLYFSLDFLNFIFVYCWFFFHYFTQWLLSCLIRCVHKFFDLHLRVFMLCVCVQNLVEETIWSIHAQESLKALGALRLLSLGEKFIF